MKKSAIILAAGQGKRFRSDIPKQFLSLGDKPMLYHSLNAFDKAFENIDIIVVLPETWLERWEKEKIDIPHRIVAGGNNRHQSAREALKMISDEGIVGIHDGARPLISTALIQKAFREAEVHGSAIPCLLPTDTVIEKANDTAVVRDRQQFRLVQTPQCFLAAEIRKAYHQSKNDMHTDDASVWTEMGETLHLIEGESTNIKITHQHDLAIAGELMNNSALK